MTKPYILNERERAALLALSQQDQVPAHSNANRDFGRTHLEALVELGLAHRIFPSAEHGNDDFQIADEGWHCIYVMSKAQIRRQTERKPVPFRIWQWPLPAAIRKAA